MCYPVPVTLKEHRRLILVWRETPLSTVQLEAATRLSQAGAIVMPLSPPFYFGAHTVDELATAFTDHLLSLLSTYLLPKMFPASRPDGGL